MRGARRGILDPDFWVLIVFFAFMIPLKDINPTRTAPFLTYILIAVNALAFFLQISRGLEESVRSYGAIPYFLFRPGAESAEYLEVPHRRDRFWGARRVVVERPRPGAFGSLFTSMFMHGDLFHLLFNMLFLWVFGNNIEDSFGHFKFIIFYLACGVAAAFAHSVFNPESLIPMVGASGAISGVMGAYLLLYPRASVVTLIPIFFFFHLVRLPAFVFIGVWFFIQLLSIGSPANIAFLAHVGGFVAGLILTRPFERRWLTG